MIVGRGLCKSGLLSLARQRIWGFPGAREALFVMCVAMIPRCVGLGAFMTVDEPTWMTRSKRFAEALLNTNALKTDQSRHPGVTLMWLGTLSVGTKILLGYMMEPTPRPPFTQFAEGFKGPDMADVAQASVALSCSLCLALCVLVLAQLMDPLTALCVGLFVALEPWLIGHSKVFHLDMLMTTFMFLSFLLLLMDVRRRSNVWVVLSGAAGALAVLTKIPASIITWAVPCVALARVITCHGLRGVISWRAFRDLVSFGALWVGAFFGTVLLVWPAFLFHPLVTGKRVLSGIIFATETYSLETSFSSADGTHKVGPSYLVSGIPALVSPFSLILAGVGLVLLVWFLLKKRRGVWPVVAVLAMASLYVGLMVQGAMLAMRYLLMAVIAVDVLAALGPAALLRRVTSKRQRAWMLAGIFLPSCLLAGYWVPYGTLYMTPLLMGRSIDQDVICRGWGEGIKEAADYLNQKPNAETLKVATWYGGLLGFYLKGSWVELERSLSEPVDYVVLYANQIQRRREAQVIDLYWAQTPEKVIRLKGRDLVWIYPGKKG